MAFKHGKDTVIMVDSNDLSAYANNTEPTYSADSHDTTTYGKQAHTYSGGLKDGSITVSGVYDDTADTGPRAVLRPLMGQVVPFTFQPEGEGAGLPQETGMVLVGEYSETHPVADMKTWTVNLQFSDELDTTAQV